LIPFGNNRAQYFSWWWRRITLEKSDSLWRKIQRNKFVTGSLFESSDANWRTWLCRLVKTGVRWNRPKEAG
jgi:hypothetical protein